MSLPNGTPGIDASGLRARLPQKPDQPQKAESVETAQEAVHYLNEQEKRENKDEKDKKTYGRTPDGTGEYHVLETCWPGLHYSYIIASHSLETTIYHCLPDPSCQNRTNHPMCSLYRASH